MSEVHGRSCVLYMCVIFYPEVYGSLIWSWYRHFYFTECGFEALCSINISDEMGDSGGIGEEEWKG